MADAHVQAFWLKASARVLLHVLNTRFSGSASPCVWWSITQNGDRSVAVACWKHVVRIALNPLPVAALAEGDPLPPECDRAPFGTATLDLLYRSERSRLLGFVRRKTSRDDVEDIVQSSFVRMAERGQAGDLASPSAYLRRTAHNILIDVARSGARAPAIIPQALDEGTIADADPVAALEARDRLRRVEDAVSRLKPLTRQIFLACRVDGYSHAEIAAQTGLSVKGVEKQMGKAIKQMSRHLRHND